MGDLSINVVEGTLSMEFDESLYPKDAIYGAAYVFIDRCYVHLDRVDGGRVKATLKAKPAARDRDAMNADAFAAEFENELLGQAWRRQILDENKSFIESITASTADGSASEPEFDDLLSMEGGDEGAFEDPLGIAMSWEDKYAKKKEEPAAPANGSSEGGAS